MSAVAAGGTIASSPAAAVIPYCMESFTMNSLVTMDTGFVWKEEARISGIWNWFQALRNMMSALDITTG